MKGIIRKNYENIIMKVDSMRTVVAVTRPKFGYSLLMWLSIHDDIRIPK
jgi:hypothetical protein